MLGKTLKLMFHFERPEFFSFFFFYFSSIFFFNFVSFRGEKKSLPLTIFHRNAFVKWAHR